MKKTLLTTLALLGAVGLHAEYTPWRAIYCDSSRIDNHVYGAGMLRGQSIADVAIDGHDNLLVATLKDLYIISEVNKVVDNQGFNILSIAGSSSTFGAYKTEVPPMLQTSRGGNSVSLMLSRAVATTSDYKQWDVVGASSAAGSDKIELTRFTGMAMAANGTTYICGAHNGAPAIYYSLPSGDKGIYDIPRELAVGYKLNDLSFRDLNVDKDGALWMRARRSTDLWKFANGVLSVVDNIQVLDVEVDNSGVAYVAGTNGIYSIDTTNKVKPVLARPASLINFDNRGYLWYVPTDAKGRADTGLQPFEHEAGTLLARYNLVTGQTFCFTQANSPIGGRIKSILSDKKGVTYVVAESPDAIFYFNDDKPTYSNGWSFLSSYYNGRAAVDSNRWVATFTSTDSLGTYFNAVVEQGDSLIFYVEKGGVWQVSQRIARSNVPTITKGIVEFKGKLYTTGDQPYVLENGKFVPLLNFQQKVAGTLHMAADTASLWMGSLKGLIRYDGENFTSLTKKNSIPGQSVTGLVSQANSVFVATTDGLGVYSSGEWKFFDKKANFANAPLGLITADIYGTAYMLATADNAPSTALYTHSNGAVTKEALPRALAVQQLLADDHGNLWLYCGGELACRKANGEYVFYNATNSPLVYASGDVNYLFYHSSELRIVQTKGTDNSRYNTFRRGPQVFILQIKN